MHLLRPLRRTRVGILVLLCTVAGTTTIAVPYARAAINPANAATVAPTGHTFSSALDGRTTVKITAQGNVAEFRSPDNFGTQSAHFTEPRDGYILCSNTTRAFDFGTGVLGGLPTFRAPTTTFANGVFTVVRTTSDGRLELTQKFSFDGASKRLRVVMTVTNLAATSAFNVALRRQADFDVDSAGVNAFAGGNNSWLRPTDSVVGWDDQQANVAQATHGMMLLNESDNLGAFVGVAAPSFDTTTCGLTNLNATPVAAPSDQSASLSFRLFTLGAGQSRHRDCRLPAHLIFHPRAHRF